MENVETGRIQNGKCRNWKDAKWKMRTILKQVQALNY